MNEFNFWSRWVRPALHAPRSFVCKKVQDRYIPGQPDCEYAFRGQQGKFEMKYRSGFTRDGVVDVAVSPTQRIQLAEWYHASHGQASVLLGVGQRWYLLPWNVPETMTQEQLLSTCYAFNSLKELGTVRDVLSAPLPYDASL